MSKSLTLEIDLAGRPLTVRADTAAELIRHWWIFEEMNREAEYLYDQGASQIVPYTYEDEDGKLGFGLADAADPDTCVELDLDEMTGELLPAGMDPLPPKHLREGEMPPPE